MDAFYAGATKALENQTPIPWGRLGYDKTFSYCEEDMGRTTHIRSVIKHSPLGESLERTKYDYNQL